MIANEDNSVGKGRTHMWRSGNAILFYDRFSPNIYSLSDTTYNILYSLETENLPDEKMINKMINKFKENSSNRTMEDSSVILDIQDVYMTPDYTSIKINSTPPQQLFIDNASGDIMEVKYDERFSYCRPGAMAVDGDYFITVRPNREEDTYDIVLYNLKPKS